MVKNVILINVNARKESASKVQQILTAWGCNIKTRLGLHEGTLENCTESGLIFLELVGNSKDHEEMARKLNLLQGVEARLIVFSGE
ncbi:MAG: hypothetical protein ACOY90_08680 [Candidatus Zhuqueibacterota bacterium]